MEGPQLAETTGRLPYNSCYSINSTYHRKIPVLRNYIFMANKAVLPTKDRLYYHKLVISGVHFPFKRFVDTILGYLYRVIGLCSIQVVIAG